MKEKLKEIIEKTDGKSKLHKIARTLLEDPEIVIMDMNGSIPNSKDNFWETSPKDKKYHLYQGYSISFTIAPLYTAVNAKEINQFIKAHMEGHFPPGTYKYAKDSQKDFIETSIKRKNSFPWTKQEIEERKEISIIDYVEGYGSPQRHSASFNCSDSLFSVKTKINYGLMKLLDEPSLDIIEEGNFPEEDEIKYDRIIELKIYPNPLVAELMNSYKVIEHTSHEMGQQIPVYGIRHDHLNMIKKIFAEKDTSIRKEIFYREFSHLKHCKYSESQWINKWLENPSIS